MTSLVAEGDADGRKGAESHVGVIVEGWHHLYFTHQELYSRYVVRDLNSLLLEQSLDELLCALLWQESNVERHKVGFDDKTFELLINSILGYD